MRHYVMLKAVALLNIKINIEIKKQVRWLHNLHVTNLAQFVLGKV